MNKSYEIYYCRTVEQQKQRIVDKQQYAAKAGK